MNGQQVKASSIEELIDHLKNQVTKEDTTRDHAYVAYALCENNPCVIHELGKRGYQREYVEIFLRNFTSSLSEVN